jgi:hypothetical protein
LYDTAYNKNWDLYDFTHGQSVCSKKEVTAQITAAPCKADCEYVVYAQHEYWKELAVGLDGEEAARGLFCRVEDEDLNRGNFAHCSCPCHKMVEVERVRPSVPLAAFSYFAQAACTCIVGISLGLRCGMLIVSPI